MPTYEFICKNCGNRFSVFTTVAGRDKVQCENCQSRDLQQVFSGLTFFKSGSRGGGSTGSSGCSRGSCSGCPGC
ncbi:MAG TPA: hypothetical protein DCE07_03780 [Peptococcaceae bacterium]|nr:hypothetical protein [Peptococcaceae bacterium]